MVYEQYNNTICLNQDALIELGLLSYNNLQNWCRNDRSKIKRLRTAGRGRTGLIEFASIPQDMKNIIIDRYGNPYLKDDRELFTDQISIDDSAIDFFKTYLYEDGRGISDNKIKQYICEAELLNTYNQIVLNYEAKCKATRRKANKGKLKLKLSTIINDLKTEYYPGTQTQKYSHKLPTNWRALDRKLNGVKGNPGYLEIGYEALVHKNAGNNSAQKIKGDVAKWLLAMYSMPNKIVIPVLHAMYMQETEKHDWPELSESAIYKWLHEPEQEKLWIISRDGVDVYKNKYGHKLARDKEQWFPNAYWGIDGTKLDWMHYYDNDLGAAAKLKIDTVIDVYSEKIIGWSYSETENHEDHFKAVKMAFQEAQTRPYLFTYDGQSGHTSNRMQELYGKMVAKGGCHYKHAAYEHSSPVEQIFNRLQQQVANHWWFSDKQSIKVRMDKNKPNMDFILANKHKLPTKEELLKAWAITVNEWNEGKHPLLKCTRNESYGHEMQMSEPVNYLDMIDMFWIYTPDTVTYRADGLRVQIANKKYHFEVYNVSGDIDLRFRERWVNKKFFVKYDPEQLDNYVGLYLKLPDGDKQYVADAQPVRRQQQIPLLMKEGDKAQFTKDYQVRKIEKAAVLAKIIQIQNETGITPERLIEDQELKIKFGGKLPKKLRNEAESESFYSRL